VLRRALPALVAFASLTALCLLAGERMRVNIDFYQFLDCDLLATQLGESLLHMHMQPPLLNALLGVAVKLAALTGSAKAMLPLLTVSHVLLGAAAVVAWVSLADALFEERWRRIAFLVLTVGNPVFHITLLRFFYTFHETVLLALLAAVTARWLRERRLLDFAAMGALLTLLTWAHSLFHFVWALVYLAAAMVFAPRLADEAQPRRPWLLSVVALSTVVLLLAWPAKNWVMFGVFSPSSWTGLNLIHGLPGGEQPVGEFPPEIPSRYADVPALTNPHRQGDARNWNHYGVIAVSRERLDRALEVMREQPSAVLAKAGRNHWHFTRSPSRQPYTGRISIDGDVAPRLTPWIWACDRIVYQDFRSGDTLWTLETPRDPLRLLLPLPHRLDLDSHSDRAPPPPRSRAGEPRGAHAVVRDLGLSDGAVRRRRRGKSPALLNRALSLRPRALGAPVASLGLR